MFTVSTNYAQCLHVCSVYRLYNGFSTRNVHTYTQASYIGMVSVYACSYTRVCVFTCVYVYAYMSHIRHGYGYVYTYGHI